MDRKKYGREWRRRKYERRLAVLNRGAMTCQRRFGRFGICGGAIQVGGVCNRCERLKLGLCADCPAPVAGTVRKARRCAACTKRAYLESMARYRDKHRALVNRRAKDAARKNRQRNADYKRLWRAANRDKVSAQKRRYSLRQPATAYAYQRAYRLYYGDPETHAPPLGPRHCLGGCGTEVRGRVKKCAPCKAALRASALRMLANRTLGS